jgi:hypothetical protein
VSGNPRAFHLKIMALQYYKTSQNFLLRILDPEDERIMMTLISSYTAENNSNLAHLVVTHLNVLNTTCPSFLVFHFPDHKQCEMGL